MKLELSINKFENEDVIATSCGSVDGLYIVSKIPQKGLQEQEIIAYSVYPNYPKNKFVPDDEPKRDEGIYHIVNGVVEENVCPGYDALIKAMSNPNLTKSEIQELQEKFCKNHGFKGIIGV